MTRSNRDPELWVNFCKNRDSPATPGNSNILIFCSNDLYSDLFPQVLSRLFEDLDFIRKGGLFENRHFSIPAITEKKCKMMHFEIIRIDKRLDIYR